MVSLRIHILRLLQERINIDQINWIEKHAVKIKFEMYCIKTSSDVQNYEIKK